ncbi:hypothetical protein [Neorhodopirellula pilleata]|uniref:Alpha/beta hydrolase family protein n=1 Tax=Neorhodopirellula pilleata TaxID=2714738 RepID=A0A5C6AVP3_9BACT|nr:hypothetical protein [Neorhodopirellula pilleata]TWU03511.1 hypothetical protein Pla100_04380 [Neorhodopirellula pilleata]
MINQFTEPMTAVLLALLCLAWTHVAYPDENSTREKGQSIYTPTRLTTYKEVGDIELKLHILEPEGHQANDRAPVIVLFFGGGWSGGQPERLYGH